MRPIGAENLTYRYGRGRSPAVADVSLEVGRGQLVTLLGPNGCGKTTLLDLLATRRRPADGRLTLFGSPASDRPGLRRRLGHVADQVPHFEHLTGRENAHFFARAAGVPRGERQRRVAVLLERFDLGPAADSPVLEYSFGMRRKLALVAALVHEPDLVLLDEPTLGVDAAGRAALDGLLETGMEAGGAVVVASNDPGGFAVRADRVVMLERGRVVAADSPTALLRAVAGDSVVEVRHSGGVVAPDIPGAEVATAAPGHTTLRSGRSHAVIAALPRLLDAYGARIRSIRVREPDLGDAFERLTGSPWSREKP